MLNRYYPITRYPTDIPGLLYRPSVEPQYSDHADHIEPFHSLVTDRTTPDQYYSAANRSLLQGLIYELGLDLKGATGCILEIGVAKTSPTRPFKNTSTCILTRYKADGVVYLGVDLATDKQVTSDQDKNIYYLLGCDSKDDTTVIEKLNELIWPTLNTSIGLLHVDGDHSVSQVLNDWQYTEFLSPHGIAVFHDTNVHPGPAVVLDAVDPNVFEVVPYFQDRPGDFGMTIVRRKRTRP